jgi:hypothetical protein
LFAVSRGKFAVLLRLEERRAGEKVYFFYKKVEKIYLEIGKMYFDV